MTESKTEWGGALFDTRTARILQSLDDSTIIPIRITQGSYSDAVGASAGTHSEGGAGDISTRGLTKTMKDTLIRKARKRGLAAYVRPTGRRWSEHIHFVAIQPGGRNDKGVLSDSAWKQVREYYDHGDGLVGDAPDPHAGLGVKPTTFEAYLDKSSFPLKDFHSFGTPESARVHDGSANKADRVNVLRIQKRHKVGLSGKYGVMTKAKVVSFQLWKGLKPTGRYGQSTWDKAFPPS